MKTICQVVLQKKEGMQGELRVQKAVRSDFSMEEVGMNSKLVKRFGG